MTGKLKVSIEMGAGNARIDPELIHLMHDEITSAGGEVVSTDSADALVWCGLGDSDALAALLDANPNIKWVQLPWAGVESFAGSGLFDRDVAFTCAKGAYASQVGEHAFMLTLTCLRNVVRQARAKAWTEMNPEGVDDKRVTILGGGGIARTAIAYLRTGGANITVLRRSAEPVEGANRTLQIEALESVLPETEVLMLALALTPETQGIIDERRLALLPQGASVINVARGKHIETDALVDALRSGHIAAVGLDVTEPEPLPDGHALWDLDNVLITSHCADSDSYVAHQLARRVGDNVARMLRGDALTGLVDPKSGY